MKFTEEKTNKWVEARLTHLGLTQDEFAAKAGISKSDISRYKQQKARPRIEHVEKIAKAFGVDVLTVMIVFGAVEPDGELIPRIEPGQKNTITVWQL